MRPYRFLTLALLAWGFAASLSAIPAKASYEECADRFRVVNDSSIAIDSIFMRPTGGVWGDDLLGSDILAPGFYVRPVAGFSLGSRWQDVEVVFRNGSDEWINDIDVCNYNAEFR